MSTAARRKLEPYSFEINEPCFAELPEARPNRERDVQDFSAVGVAVGCRGPTEIADVLGELERDAGHFMISAHDFDGRPFVRHVSHLLAIHGQTDADGVRVRRFVAFEERVLGDERDPDESRAELEGFVLDRGRGSRGVLDGLALACDGPVLASELPRVGEDVADDFPIVDIAEEIVERSPGEFFSRRVVEDVARAPLGFLAVAVDPVAGAGSFVIAEGVFRARRVVELHRRHPTIVLT